jgi:hypothetical protein
LGLGTLAVRRYLATIGEPEILDVDLELDRWALAAKSGPLGNYGAILFIEKEGFWPLFEQVQLRRRYDIAIMSTKGLSNTSARRLIEHICSTYSIPALVLRDFDRSGFLIAGTLKNSTRRYTYKRSFDIVDLGLRVEDVREYNLESEEFVEKMSPSMLRQQLRENGATEEEINYIAGANRMRRVELNAFTSDGLIEWLERKLESLGIEKVVPEQAQLEEVYRAALVRHEFKEAAHDLLKQAREKAKNVSVPDDLKDQVMKLLEDNRHLPWDQAVARIVGEREQRGVLRTDRPSGIV